MKEVQLIPSGNERNIFRMLRIARNIQVKDLADALSVSPAYITAIENGKRTPSERLQRDYAIALGVDEEILTTFKPNEQGNTRFENILLTLLQLICSTDG